MRAPNGTQHNLTQTQLQSTDRQYDRKLVNHISLLQLSHCNYTIDGNLFRPNLRYPQVSYANLVILNLVKNK